MLGLCRIGEDLVKSRSEAPAASSNLASAISLADASALACAAGERCALYGMPYLLAVCGVSPNCANTGMPASTSVRTTSGNSAAASTLISMSLDRAAPTDADLPLARRTSEDAHRDGDLVRRQPREQLRQSGDLGRDYAHHRLLACRNECRGFDCGTHYGSRHTCRRRILREQGRQ